MEVGDIPELALFEQDKENLRPKRTGRSARALQEVFCSDAKALADQKQEARQEFEARLAELSGDVEQSPGNGNDKVVDLWLEYANWAAEWYPTTSAEERSVLERATDFLAEKPQFNANPNHLKLWLRLAAMEKEPQEIFLFLFTNDIGKREPALYEEWAFVLEKRKEYQKAQDLLFDGMFQCRFVREHYDRLYALREALMKRMEELGIEADPRRGPRMLTLQEVPRSRRPALNPITSDEASELNRPEEQRPFESRCLSSGRPALARMRGVPGFSSQAIFEDTEGDELQLPRESIFSNSGLVPRRAPKPEKMREKENTQKPEAVFPRTAKGGRGKIPKARPAPCASACPLPVYVDEEFQVESEKPSMPRRALPSEASSSVPDTSSVPTPPKPTWPSTPKAPEKESIRKRRAAREAEENASSSLAVSLSQLHIREEPPPKRVCRVEEEGMAAQAAPGTPQTPPRRAREISAGQHGRSPRMSLSWSPQRTSPRARRGSRTSQKETSSSKRSIKSEMDQEGLSALQALQGMFGTGRGEGRSCSRLLVFED